MSISQQRFVADGVSTPEPGDKLVDGRGHDPGTSRYFLWRLSFMRLSCLCFDIFARRFFLIEPTAGTPASGGGCDGLDNGGQYRTRTCDPRRVKAVL